MPELPEVERARLLAATSLSGKLIAGIVADEDTIVFQDIKPRAFCRRLKGRRVRAVCRKGKHLWFELDRPPHPSFHFGMTGRFTVYTRACDRPPYFKVEFRMDDGTRLAMINKRRLGRIRLLEKPLLQPPISRLGFDPLIEMISQSEFTRRLLARKAPVKAVLLDQSFAAGIGNWIADEILYQARIDPHRRACGLSEEEAQRIRHRLRAIIRRAVAVNADSSRFPRSWLFHYRWGKNRQAVTIQKDAIAFSEVGGRTTAWVPDLQS
ncbi:Fpg/Nei family DNA glycosylase [Acidobacteriota bacterium]